MGCGRQNSFHNNTCGYYSVNTKNEALAWRKLQGQVLVRKSNLSNMYPVTVCVYVCLLAHKGVWDTQQMVSSAQLWRREWDGSGKRGLLFIIQTTC